MEKKNAPWLLLIAVGSNQPLAFHGRYAAVAAQDFTALFSETSAEVLSRRVRWWRLPVHLSSVLLRVDGHSSNAQLGAGSKHADSDLTL